MKALHVLAGRFFSRLAVEGEQQHLGSVVRAATVDNPAHLCGQVFLLQVQYSQPAVGKRDVEGS